MFRKKIIFSIFISISMLMHGFSLLSADGVNSNTKEGSNKEQANQEAYADGYTKYFEIVVTLSDIKPNMQSMQKIFLSDYITNAPIENANIQIEITGVDNSKITSPIQIEPGVYEFSIEFPELKKYDFLFNITSGDVNDLIAINEVDLAHTKQTAVSDTVENKSFLVKALENWFWLIIFIILISIIAFIFYRMGKKNNSKINFPQTDNSTTKYEV